MNQHEMRLCIRVGADVIEGDREENVIFDNDTCPLVAGLSKLCLSCELASTF